MGRKLNTLGFFVGVAVVCAGCATPRDVAIPLIVSGAGAAALAPAIAAIVASQTDYPMGDALVIGAAPGAMLLAAGFILLELTETSSAGVPVNARDYMP